MFTPESGRLQERLRRGEACDVVWLALGSAALAEMAARSGPGAIVIDLQHGLFERRDLEAAVGCGGPGVPVLARVAGNDAVSISTGLDSGAAGVIVPMIETADAARQALAHAHYPPRGLRSAGGVRMLADLPAYMSGIGAAPFVAVMIETVAGLEAAEAIAAVEGIDLVFIGTGDLAFALGVGPGDPVLEAACARVRAACAGAGVPCGIFTADACEAARRRAEGYLMVVSASDIALFAAGLRDARATLDAAAPAGSAPFARVVAT
ncbi:MAG: hypothetical protein JJU40_01930 [Rhodobacteraceae bacterium]|nr:hypothetical protein [Paracoccaceae bacterium]